MKPLNLSKPLAIVAAMLPALLLNAQSKKPTYTTAIGLQSSVTPGISIKHFFTPNQAVEGLISMWPFVGVIALYEKHNNLDLAGLKWYCGGGGHLGVYNDRVYYVKYPKPHYYESYSGTAVGIDGIIGIEYKIPPIPMAISADLRPFIEVNSWGGAYASFVPSLGIKFTFQ